MLMYYVNSGSIVVWFWYLHVNVGCKWMVMDLMNFQSQNCFWTTCTVWIRIKLVGITLIPIFSDFEQPTFRLATFCQWVPCLRVPLFVVWRKRWETEARLREPQETTRQLSPTTQIPGSQGSSFPQAPRNLFPLPTEPWLVSISKTKKTWSFCWFPSVSMKAEMHLNTFKCLYQNVVCVVDVFILKQV